MGANLTVDGIVDRRVFLPEVARGKRVLHLGCVDEHLTETRYGTGDLLHQELAHAASSLVGVDISERGIDLLRELVPGEYLVGDVEDLSALELPAQVDIVIAAELIEHLGAPSRFLMGLANYLRTSGARAVITTPNAYSWRHFVVVALRRQEMVHEDHRLLYSVRTLERSLRDAGLEIIRLRMHTWSPPPGLTGRVLGWLDRLILRWQPLLAVGLVVDVRPVSGANEA